MRVVRVPAQRSAGAESLPGLLSGSCARVRVFAGTSASSSRDSSRGKILPAGVTNPATPKCACLLTENSGPTPKNGLAPSLTCTLSVASVVLSIETRPLVPSFSPDPHTDTFPREAQRAPLSRSRSRVRAGGGSAWRGGQQSQSAQRAPAAATSAQRAAESEQSHGYVPGLRRERHGDSCRAAQRIIDRIVGAIQSETG
jgi:hypothetical protein